MKSSHVAALLLTVSLLISTGCTEDKKTSKAPEPNKVKVTTAKLAEHYFCKSLRIQGNVQAVEKASIAARVGGIIDSLNVREGEMVKKDQILFTIDRVNLENQLTAAREDLKVELTAEKAAISDKAIAETLLKKSKLDLKRSQNLYSSNAISKDSFETAEVQCRNYELSLAKATAALEQCKYRLVLKKTALEIAEKNLEDSVLKAPFSGIITRRNKEVKEHVGVGSEIFYLENQDKLEVSALFSGVYYDAVKEGNTVNIIVDGKKTAETKIKYKSPSIEPLSRTFEIRADLPAGTGITSGLICDIEVVLAERQGYGLPVNAVIFRKGGKFVAYEAADGKAHAVDVEQGISSGGFCEIIGAEKLMDKNFIVEGQHFVSDGSLVVVEKTL